MKKIKQVQNFLADVKILSRLPVLPPYKKFFLKEYPFDAQLISLSALYRKSREEYLKLGGRYAPSVCSTMRSLSTHDLFKNEIEYTPMHSEIIWLSQNAQNMPDAADQIKSVKHFHDISIFHEQNHRIIWKLLPPAPVDQGHLRRYLNFAESLVVALDLALADQIGAKLSKAFERMSLLYRPAGPAKLTQLSPSEYRQYLLSAFSATYYALERVHSADILKAVNYILPAHKKHNRQAVSRGLELNQDFTEITNPQWQQIYWQSAAVKLSALHGSSKKPVLFLPADPLDLDREIQIADRIFDFYGI